MLNFAITEMSKVLTAGSLKYADRNWEKGWSKCLASLRRHIDKFESGVDFDERNRTVAYGSCYDELLIYIRVLRHLSTGR